MVNNTAYIRVGANITRLSYKLLKGAKKVVNYPRKRKAPDWLNTKVLSRTMARIEDTGIRFDTQIIVPVQNSVIRNKFKKLKDNIRKKVQRACGKQVFLLIRLHRVIKPGGFECYHLHIAIAGSTVEMTDKAVRALLGMFEQEQVSIRQIESEEHSKNLIRYLFSKKQDDLSYHQDKKYYFRPWFFVNYKYIHEVAKKQREQKKNKDNKAAKAFSSYDTINIEVPGKVAETFKKSLARYLKQKIGRMPYFAKLKAGFSWLGWVYQYKDILKILKRAFELHNIPIPPELAY